MAKLLSLIKLAALPPRTLLSFQCRERPNKFYPIRFSVPPGITIEEIVTRENDWMVMVVEFYKEVPRRWAAFPASQFRPSEWSKDDKVSFVTVLATDVTRALVPVEGDSSALIKEISLTEWMQTRNKEKTQ